MSQFPTCPKHLVMKPCVHCDPKGASKIPIGDRKVCGQVNAGSTLEECACGNLRQKGKRCSQFW